MRTRTRLVSLLAVTAGAFIVFQAYFSYGLLQWHPQAFHQNCTLSESHRITEIMRDAHTASQNVKSRASTSLEDATAKYRESRGRHPPPGFEIWYQTAKKQNVLLVEDFFDQIYTDLDIFWGIEPKSLRSSLAAPSPKTDIIKIRSGRVEPHSDGGFRQREWSKMIDRFASNLPDLDILINRLDEPRVLVPWADASAALNLASKQRKQMMEMPPSRFRAQTVSKNANVVGRATSAWQTNARLHRQALIASCPPGSAIHDYDLDTQMNVMPAQATSFVDDVFKSKDICLRPELLTQHGFLIEPRTISFTTSIVPILSSAKLVVNHDIVLPDPAYFSEGKFFSGKDWLGDWSSYYSWKRKTHGLIWRGASTGGKPRESTLKNFHRHRFVSTMNASSIYGVSIGTGVRDDFKQWLDRVSDVAFSTIYCEEFGKNCCASISRRFCTKSKIQMREQYRWKYLPDIDGNSLSGRFHAFMLSNSATMKATLFREWHDARLTPWKHYIPFDLSSADIYEVMKYFLGYADQCAHDADGESIARAGQNWSREVLRKEDMETYVHRLLLEYARIMNDDRDSLGYVEDLIRR